ncbi:Alpha/Beta hydrolase protein [Bisporella sp. PMI_857]|nr:Alpha/Beta hydrolase protein [Bisporella sp. PMI_857]
MTTSDRILRFFSPHTGRTGLLIGSSIATTLVAISVARIAFPGTPNHIILSPRDTQLPRLSPSEQNDLPYPPDVFPGARDVTSRYGTIRVYEWGPEDGRKVLLVHGISTPCLALGSIANGLVEIGCRVILFDLWGRGYSDSSNLPHDSRLYTAQILLALTSSPLAWTPNGFSIVGYSFGGGIAVDFATSHPQMVKSIVLLAPGGLIRPNHFGWSSRILYLGLIPDRILHWIVQRRLQGGNVHAREKKTATAVAVVNEEIKGARDPSFETAPLSKARPDVTVASAVSWQIQNHEGFVRSFVSSIKHGPVEGKEESRRTWKELGKRKDRVLIMAGSTDTIIIPEELKIDATELIGSANIEWRIIDGGHEFPITRGDEVVKQISEVWGT